MSQNRTILITGSSSGFGLLTTQTLLEKGYTVVATMRGLAGKNAGRAAELQNLADETTGTLHLVELDVTDDSSVEAAVQQALNLTGQIDVVVNNAGYGVGGLTEGFTTDQFHQILDTNVLGVHRINRAVLPAMRKQGTGLLIHVSSVMGRIVLPFAGPYTATKFALEGLAESYRYELAGTGIDVTIVEPGGFGTNFLENSVTPNDEARVASYGPLAEMPQQMWRSVGEMISGDDAPDPQEVPDAIAALIEAPAGQRPLRVVVDPMTGGGATIAVNQTTDQIQNELLNSFGMSDLLSVKSGG